MRRRAVFWILGLVAVSLGAAAFALAPGVQSGNLCLSCHQDQVAALQVTPHGSEDCASCHVGRGSDAALRFEPRLVGMALAKATGGLPDAAEAAMTVADENCITCHEGDMPWLMQDKKPGGRALAQTVAVTAAANEGPAATSRNAETLGGTALFIRAEHDYHLNELGLHCTDCHGQTTHAGLAAKDPAGHAVAGTASYQAACDSCHNDTQNQLDCARCHTQESLTQPLPGVTQWMNPHAMDLAQAGLTCGDCHQQPVHANGAGGTGKLVQARTTAEDGAVDSIEEMRRQQLYETANCARCHEDSGNAAYRKNFQAVPAAVADDQCRTCHESPDKIMALWDAPPPAASSGG